MSKQFIVVRRPESCRPDQFVKTVRAAVATGDDDRSAGFRRNRDLRSFEFDPLSLKHSL